MFLTGAPDTAGRSLRVSRAEHRVFDGNSPRATDPAVRDYLSDMVGPYGLALREDLLDAGAGHSYGEMAEPLIDAIVPAGAPVDVLVLAYGIHDVRLGRATATYLGSRCPGDPLAFAVCDQGVAAPFTALRVIDAYATTGACRRALMVIAEQTGWHYELAAPAPIPARNAAVAVLLEGWSGAEPLTVRQQNGIAPDRVGERVVAEVGQFRDGRSGATVILGGGLQSIVDDSVTVPEGQPYTGVWWELSAGLPVWQANGRWVLLVDYDAALECLCTAALRIDQRSVASQGGVGGTEVISMPIK